jgi:NADPH-dependent glutamate synthase beta subunit-like oxidoreductase
MTGRAVRQQMTVDRVISAVGVVGNVENLGLEKLGVKIDRGTIVIDGYCKTNVPGIYADRRRRGPADARAQGRARGRHLRRGDQGDEAARDGQESDSGLHLLPSAGRVRGA